VLWLKVAIPILMASVGVGAVAVTNDADPTTSVSTSHVWIDSPLGEVPFAPGDVAVVAHATADASITSLELFVDGDEVATDVDLDRDEKLVYGQFTWPADVGEHVLVVKQVGGTGGESAPLTVFVAEGAEPASEPTTTTTTEPGATTSTAPGETTTSTSTTSTTDPEAEPTIPPPGGTTTAPTPPPTVVPTTRPPTVTTTTRPPARPKPVIDAATFSGTPTVYAGGYCPSYSVGVQARIRDADFATVAIAGGGGIIEMVRTASSSWSATISSGFPPAAVGARTVTVTAGNDSGDTQRVVGTLTIRPGCPKD
jgi:hypothetical protein